MFLGIFQGFQRLRGQESKEGFLNPQFGVFLNEWGRLAVVEEAISTTTTVQTWKPVFIVHRTEKL